MTGKDIGVASRSPRGPCLRCCLGALISWAGFQRLSVLALGLQQRQTTVGVQLEASEHPESPLLWQA